MTPKEKAKELVMWMAMHQVWHEGDTNTDGQKERAKKCAAICVNEIVSLNCESIDDFNSNPHHYYSRPFWQEVKKEIELL